jgi:hypothetical protein
MVDLGKTGRVMFTFRCNTPRQVYLVGDFNAWDKAATPMHQDKDGLWHVTLKIAPGRHEFRYREEGDTWHTDFAACGVVRNSFGAFNSIVEVIPPIRLQAVPESYAFSAAARH